MNRLVVFVSVMNGIIAEMVGMAIGKNGGVAQIQHGTFGEVLDDRLVIMQYNACGERC